MQPGAMHAMTGRTRGMFGPSSRRAALAALLACAAWPVRGAAQKAGRIYRVGVLFSGAGASMQPHREVLREQLATHGFVEGRNLETTWRGGSSWRDLDRKAAQELVASRPDAILAYSSAMAQAAQFATQEIPIVFAQVSDPIADGVVKDYARPGGNTTGVSTRHRELLGKRFELLRDVLPRAKRVALVTPFATDPSFAAAQPAIAEAAKRLGFEVIEVLQTVAEWKVRDARAEALFVYSVLGEDFTMERLINLAAELRIASTFPDARWVRKGALLSYGTDPLRDTRLAANQLARVLGGIKPRDLPVDQNVNFVLAVNLRTARSLGIAVPQSLLLRADEVIE